MGNCPLIMRDNRSTVCRPSSAGRHMKDRILHNEMRGTHSKTLRSTINVYVRLISAVRFQVIIATRRGAGACVVSAVVAKTRKS